MKKLWILVFMFLSFVTICLAADKVELPADCKQCGMSRTSFSLSRMVIKYSDGSSSGTCSLNCVVTDMNKSNGKTVASYQVADYNTKKLIDAKKAVWVIGGNKKGVMTQVPKWAFTDIKAAEVFISKNGGKLASFSDALKAAEKEHGGNDEHKH